MSRRVPERNRSVSPSPAIPRLARIFAAVGESPVLPQISRTSDGSGVRSAHSRRVRSSTPYLFTSTIFSPRQIATIGLATKMEE